MSDYLPFARQFLILFERVPHPDGRPYTLQEVSDATGISISTLSQLRTGRNDNPQLQTVRALCRFFGVPLRYFETASEDACLTEIARKDHPTFTPELNEIAFRAAQLNARSRRNLLTMLKWVEASEKLYIETGIAPPLLEETDAR